MRQMRFWSFAMGGLLAAMLTACGGGGGSSGNPSTDAVISGTAASGAPIVGTVSARDSKGTLFGPVPIGADGRYSLNVNGGIAPFILEATGSVGNTGATVHSIASSGAMSNLNITPITNMVVAEATGLSPDNVFNNCSTTGCAIPAQSQVTLAETNIKMLLGDLLAKFGVAQTINLLTDDLVAGPVAGQSPIDKMMDAIVITPVSTAPTSFTIQPSPVTGLPATTVLLTVPPAPSGGITTAATAPLAVDPSFTTTVVTNTANALTALQGIQSQFTVLQGLFATALPSPSNPTLLALFDASFNNWGQNITAFISKITGPNGAVPGITFTNIVAAAPRPAPATQFPNDATHQWFTFVVKAPNQPAETNGPWLAIYDSISQKWLVAGNQMPAPTFVGSYTSSTPMTDAGGTTWTHVENNTVSGGLVNINHTYTSNANSITGQFSGTGLALTIDPANTTHATFTGAGTADNYVGSIGGASNLRAITMSGELWVQNDGSINMYWKANDPLTGTMIGGCSSTLGAGCATSSGSTSSGSTSSGSTSSGSTSSGSTSSGSTSTGTPPLVGSWYLGNDTNTLVTFFANGDYMQSQSVTTGTNMQPGLEHGTYTWNSSTGAFSTGGCPPIDTNGDAGFSHTTGNGCGATSATMLVNGNTLTMNYSEVGVPTTLVWTRVVDATNPIVGSWYMNNDTNMVITFFANGDYMQSQSVTTTPSTTPGLEHGTYNYDANTGAFAAACPTVDTNLQAGFSASAVTGVQCTAGTAAMNATVTVSGNSMTLVNSSQGTLTFSRVQ